MKLQRSKIENYFSTEELISALSEIEVGKDSMSIDLEISFKDAIVNVKGVMKGYFHEQSMTYDTPQYSDLYDVFIELHLITISYNTEYFEKRVRSLMLN